MHKQTIARMNRLDTRIEPLFGLAPGPAVGSVLVLLLPLEIDLAAPQWANGAPERHPATTFYRGNSEAPIKYASTARAH